MALSMSQRKSQNAIVFPEIGKNESQTTGTETKLASSFDVISRGLPKVWGVDWNGELSDFSGSWALNQEVRIIFF